MHEVEEGDNVELEVFEEEKLEEADKEEEQYAITVLEEKKAQMKPNMAAIAEYKKKVETSTKLWITNYEYILHLYIYSCFTSHAHKLLLIKHSHSQIFTS